MKKFIAAVAIATGMSTSLYAQVDQPAQNLDLHEDTVEVSTLAGLLAQKQKVATRTNEKEHINAVWKRTKTFDFTYTTTTMKPSAEVLGESRGVKLLPEYKSDWGFTLSRTKSYGLHKPIADMVRFAIDWRGFQLNVNHFKTEKVVGDKAYNSQVEKISGTPGGKDAIYKYPWNLEKYEANYAMGVGPSVTVAPFVPLHKDALDHIRLNIYFHVNYSASIIYSKGGEDFDANPKADTEAKGCAADMDKAAKVQWGHGLGTTFGLSLNYKSIGVGYETRNVTRKYKAIGDWFDDTKSEMKFSQSNVYLRINF